MPLMLDVYRLSRAKFVKRMPGGWRFRRWCYERVRSQLYKLPLWEGHAWVRPGSAIPDELVLTGSYEPSIARVIRTFARGGYTYVDVGANVGLHTIAAATARTAVNQRIFAFEPEPSTFELLRRNVESNRLTDVRCVQAAAGEEEGTLRLNVSDGTNEGAHSFVTRSNTAPGPMVPVLQLDAFFRTPENLLQDQFFMKIDVEGFEPAVLKGATELISNARSCAILVEVFPELLRSGGRAPEDIYNLLRACGCEKAYVVNDPDAPQGRAMNYYNALFVKGAGTTPLVEQLGPGALTTAE